MSSDHLLRRLIRFGEPGELRRELSAFFQPDQASPIAPELMIRMLLVRYCFGIRSVRRLCEEVHLNLVYRWFLWHRYHVRFKSRKPGR